MDEVHTGQPSLALAQKVIQRAEKAGLPADLIPAEITAIAVSADIDTESSLRTAVLEFVDTVRGVERAIAATRRGDSVPEEFDLAPLGEVTEQEWREHWPSAGWAVDGMSGPPADGTADDTAEDTDAAGDESDDEAGDEAEDNGDKADDEPAAASKGSSRGSKKRGGRR
jgi:XTP/dITP diphosphohydrolase